jgi:hypothetical protein
MGNGDGNGNGNGLDGCCFEIGCTGKKSTAAPLFCRVGPGRDGPAARAASVTAMADDWLPWLEHVPGRDSSSVIIAASRGNRDAATASAPSWKFTAPDADHGGGARAGLGCGDSKGDTGESAVMARFWAVAAAAARRCTSSFGGYATGSSTTGPRKCRADACTRGPVGTVVLTPPR